MSRPPNGQCYCTASSMAKRKSVTGLKKKKKSVRLVASDEIRSPLATSAELVTKARPKDDRNALHSAVLSSVDGNKKRRHETEDSDDNDEPSLKRFAVLKPRVKHVHQDVIQDKWEVLPEALQTRVREIFVAVGRQVITQHRDEKRRVDAQTALGITTRTLGKRLPRMPFPPKTKEAYFDYEALLRSNRAIEQQLTPTLHTIKLLESQISKEQRAHAVERSTLDELRKNAKAEESFRKKHLRKRHKVLRLDSTAKDHVEDPADSIGLAAKCLEKAQSLNENLDSAVESLIMQLGSHVESMEGNAGQVTGVRDALCEATAVLDDVLFKCLNRNDYESFLHR